MRSCIAARKIGCDKSLPACNNCLRTGRSCQGYGFKLRWATPDTQSRSQSAIQLPERLYFLHTTAAEIALWNSDILPSMHYPTNLPYPARPISSSSLTGPAIDPFLFSYCQIPDPWFHFSLLIVPPRWICFISHDHDNWRRSQWIPPSFDPHDNVRGKPSLRESSITRNSCTLGLSLLQVTACSGTQGQSHE
jgi:hypothetical protein